MLCLTENGSLLPRSYCSCIPPQKCTLRRKQSENSQWIIYLIITDFFPCLKPTWNFWNKHEEALGITASQSPPKNAWNCFPLLHWLWTGTSLRYSLGCLAKPHDYFFFLFQSDKHRNWRYKWKLELANTASVRFCSSFSVSICPSVIWLLECSWKANVKENKNSRSKSFYSCECMCCFWCNSHH